MHKIENAKKVCFVDYIPAELHINKEWEIVYWAFNPYKLPEPGLDRKRNRVKKLKSITERKKLGKRTCININERLQSGWNPFLENKNSKELTSFKDAVNVYIKHITLEYKEGNLAKDTFGTYTSKLKGIGEYLEDNDKGNIFCFQFDKQLISTYLDYRRYELGNSARTRDNYMTFIHTLCNWMVDKNYMSKNGCDSFKKIDKKVKKRIIISPAIRERIFDYYKHKNPNYLIFCMTCYYCLVRRTELSKLTVDDISIKNKTLYIHAEDAKMNKSAHVTIPERLAILLAVHIKDAKKTDYIFSENNYSPGNTRFKPNRSTSNWRRMRDKLKLDFNIKWYSLKDTGITDLITAGVDLISVRDQARHQDIKQTNEYIPKSMKKANHEILNSGVKF